MDSDLGTFFETVSVSHGLESVLSSQQADELTSMWSCAKEDEICCLRIRTKSFGVLPVQRKDASLRSPRSSGRRAHALKLSK
jgi:hypothetical protein